MRDLAALTELLTELEEEVAGRREAGASSDQTPLFLVLDDYDILRQDDEDDFGLVETQLLNLAKRGRLAGLHVLVAGYNVELRRYNQQLAQHIAQTERRVLQPDLENDGELFGSTRLQRFSQGEAPPGRGYFGYRQRLHLFQAATPVLEGTGLVEAIARLAPDAPEFGGTPGTEDGTPEAPATPAEDEEADAGGIGAGGAPVARRRPRRRDGD